jgi:hypothetical protein
MHYIEMQFNVMPALHPNGFSLHIFDLICLAFLGSILFWFAGVPLSRAPYPLKDPRLQEAITHHEIKPSSPIAISTGPVHKHKRVV